METDFLSLGVKCFSFLSWKVDATCRDGNAESWLWGGASFWIPVSLCWILRRINWLFLESHQIQIEMLMARCPLALFPFKGDPVPPWAPVTSKGDPIWARGPWLLKDTLYWPERLWLLRGGIFSSFSGFSQVAWAKRALNILIYHLDILKILVSLLFIPILTYIPASYTEPLLAQIPLSFNSLTMVVMNQAELWVNRACCSAAVQKQGEQQLPFSPPLLLLILFLLLLLLLPPPFPSPSSSPSSFSFVDKWPRVRRTILAWEWGALCLLTWEAGQPVGLIKIRPPLKISAGGPKDLHAGLLTQENLKFSENTRSLGFLSCSIPCPSMAQVARSAGPSRCGQEHRAAVQPSFYLGLNFFPGEKGNGFSHTLRSEARLRGLCCAVFCLLHGRSTTLGWESWLWLLPCQLSERMEVPR